jgi:hypothetical protein
MITDVERMDELARMICYRHRLLKRDLFLHTKLQTIVDARFHFYLLAMDDGFRVCDIQRYCERYGYPVAHAAIIYGINKIKSYEQKLIESGKFNSIRKLSREERAFDRRLRKLAQRTQEKRECESAIAELKLG